MREIKFRAWDNVNRVMCESASIYNWIEGVSMLHGRIGKEVVFLEFTGLKDKNGNPIYEGDKVKYFRDRTDYIHGIYEIAFGAGAFYLKHDTEDDLKLPTPPHAEFFEVIGNIYEN